jgi:hypothetical protein
MIEVLITKNIKSVNQYTNNRFYLCNQEYINTDSTKVFINKCLKYDNIHLLIGVPFNTLKY